VIEWVVDLRKAIGIPHTLAELGVKPEHAAQFSGMAEADPSTPSNPRPLKAPEFEQLYRSAIEGRLP
jgi:alcohol dehydrogenase class IV